MLDIVEGGASTGYVGSTYEYRTSGGSSSVTHHYFVGGVRVATAVNDSLSYVFNDHLNSASATLQKSNNAIARQRYTPWGGHRNGDVLVSDVGFTGHREYASTGLVDMGFRSYDPVLGRFAQPDTIVASTADPVAARTARDGVTAGLYPWSHVYDRVTRRCRCRVDGCRC